MFFRDENDIKYDERAFRGVKFLTNVVFFG